MRKRTAILISNPNAGRGGRGGREVTRFCERLRAEGIKVEAVSTAGPNEAARLAAAAARGGVQDVIVSGGDGTINEALQGLVGTEARLAIWPQGTANVLARELQLRVAAPCLRQGLQRKLVVHLVS